MILASQIRAARALLNWTSNDLAKYAGITGATVLNVENGVTQPHKAKLEKIIHTFNHHGVEFIGTTGVQWAQHHVGSYAGEEGMKKFFDDVRAIAKVSDEEICICGFSEDYFEDKLGDYLDYHRKEMTKFQNVHMKCLIEEKDINTGASSYCAYRWVPSETYSNVPFYIYGDRAAIICTTAPEDPLLIIIRNPAIADAYRKQFAVMWAAASEIE